VRNQACGQRCQALAGNVLYPSTQAAIREAPSAQRSVAKCRIRNPWSQTSVGGTVQPPARFPALARKSMEDHREGRHSRRSIPYWTLRLCRTEYGAECIACAKSAASEATYRSQQTAAFAHTWQTQETISVNGSVKEQDVYQVQLGPDGQQVRTLIAQPVAPSSGGRRRGILHRVKEDFKAYAQQVGALAKSYSPLNPTKVQQLYAQGSVTLKSTGSPGYSTILISNYLKQGDAIVLALRNSPKALTSVAVTSYLAQPSDVVTMQVRFASLPDGTHYASTTTVNGQSKNLTIVDRSTNFKPRTQ
jgi:hypothetical protein